MYIFRSKVFKALASGLCMLAVAVFSAMPVFADFVNEKGIFSYYDFKTCGVDIWQMHPDYKSPLPCGWDPFVTRIQNPNIFKRVTDLFEKETDAKAVAFKAFLASLQEVGNLACIAYTGDVGSVTFLFFDKTKTSVKAYGSDRVEVYSSAGFRLHFPFYATGDDDKAMKFSLCQDTTRNYVSRVNLLGYMNVELPTSNSSYPYGSVVREKFKYVKHISGDSVNHGNVDPGDHEDQPPLGAEDYGVRFIMPPDGFKQSQINTMNTTILIRVPYHADSNTTQIKVNGYLTGTGKVEDSQSTVKTKASGERYREYLYRTTGEVPFTENHIMSVRVTDSIGNVYTDTLKVSCYEGFVDEDQDGFDDRTGQDYFDRPELDPSDEPFDIWNPSTWLNPFKKLIKMLSETDGYLAFSSVVSACIGWLPAEVAMIMFAAVIFVIVLRILGR